MRVRSVLAAFLATVLVLAVFSFPALAGKGTLTITNVVNNGNGSFNVTVTSTTGMTAGDHFGARTGSSTGPGAVYEVVSIGGATACVITNTLTEENGTAFAAPVAGSAWFSTPTAQGLSRPPFQATAWDAALRRDHYLIGSLGKVTATATNTNMLVGNGTTFVTTTPSGVRTNLGLTIGTNVQAWDTQLDDVAGLTPTDNGVVIGNGSNFVVESGATLKTSLGLTIGTNVQAWDAQLDDFAGLTFAKGDIFTFDGTNVKKLAVGTNGQVLKAASGQATGLQWAADNDSGGGGTPHDLLDGSVAQDTLAGTVVRGDVVVGNATPKWARVAKGAAGTALGSDGTDTSFRTVSQLLNDGLTEAQGDVLYRGASDWTNLGPGTKGKALVTGGAAANPAWATVLAPQTAGGRITAQQDTPIPTSDQTSATLYYEPYVGGLIALYDGSVSWSLFDITAGPTLDVSALTADKNYDVFCYDSSGTATLEASAAWTNNTTRADALALQDGVWVKSGTTTRRWLGTIRTVSSSGTKVPDTAAKSYVWNAQNRVVRSTIQTEDDATWTYASGTVHAVNASGADGDWTHEYVVGLAGEAVNATASVLQIGGGGYYLMVAQDSTTAASQQNSGVGVAGTTGTVISVYTAGSSLGYHYLQALEALHSSIISTTLYSGTLSSSSFRTTLIN